MVIPKYTNEVVEQIKAYLAEGQTIAEIATLTNFSERSLTAKLSYLGLYKKQPYVNKLGLPSVKKSDLVDEIAKLVGEPPEMLESLEKCNKRVLEILIKNLTT